ncbi:hypothetical protein PTSG_04050 [Salpingoeca rosetta]|uniref:OB domain-containing protein n=1 Tax=Salpingoeca rosetta (strain ATCC 50818 / BSB-021) TaxID=946362 RepID=F2U7M6_SALR5|nr:uncharacterized protein PTSG_04050 [Salpingoeca rosetta]EGD83443.1 hypothetical protein PTSG_04050 [Salpingoeca rosetta]|eukprot:XP_004994947.1 hypothetical protein PTSG_04050 [Salpingoeca rosetta]
MGVAVKDARPGAKGLDCTFIVVEKDSVSSTKEGEQVIVWRVADPTGSILLSTFGEAGAAVKEADILRLKNGYCTRYRDQAVVYIGRGTLERVGEFTMMYSLEPDMSKLPPEPTAASV